MEVHRHDRTYVRTSLPELMYDDDGKSRAREKD